MRSTALAVGVFATMVAGCAALERTPDEAGLDRPEASIPFADQRSSIRDWQADGDRGIWVQDAHRNWYYGRFHSVCFGLDFATIVGFRTGSTARLDRFSSIEVPQHGRCTLRSFTTSDGPPDKDQQAAGEAADHDPP